MSKKVDVRKLRVLKPVDGKRKMSWEAIMHYSFCLEIVLQNIE